MFTITASGSPLDFGKIYGTKAKTLIQQAVKSYGRLLQPVMDLKVLEGFRELLRTHAPDLLLQLSGMSIGAGVTMAELLMLNARSELITIGGLWAPPECTSVAIAPERSTDGVPRVAQNWDWLHGMKGNQLVLYGKPDGEPAYVSFCEPGHLAKISINEHGLAVSLNFLHAPPSEVERVKHGLPVHLILRMVLKAKTVGEAVELLKGLPRGDGANFMMADAEGTVASIELRPSRVDVIKPEDGLVTHANDYEYCRSPARRSARLRAVLEGGKISREDLFEALRDHEPGAVEQICAHSDSPDSSSSIVSVALEPHSQILWLSEGLPCECKPIHPYSVP